MITQSKSFSNSISRHRFISLMMKAMLAPKELSPSSKLPDETYLKICAAKSMLQFELHSSLEA